MRTYLFRTLTAAPIVVAVGCSGATSNESPAADPGGGGASIDERHDDGGGSSNDGDAGNRADSSTTTGCKLVTSLRPPDGRRVLAARYLTPTKIVFSATQKEWDTVDVSNHVFEQEICDSAPTAKDLGSLPGSGLFALGANGTLVVPSAPLGGTSVFGRWKNGAFTQAASDCEYAEPTFIDLVGSTFVVSTEGSSSRRIWLTSLDAPSCNITQLKAPGDEIYAVNAEAARLSPDGTKVLMGPRPGNCRRDPTDNDLVLMDVASKAYTRVPYAPAVEPNPECGILAPFAWYPDNARVLILRPNLVEADVTKGTSREVKSAAYRYYWPPIQAEVAPDGKSALAITQFEIQVLAL
jgi:hypothetical protein